MNLTEINLREKKFHNTLQSKKKSRFENIFYKALYNLYEDFNSYIFEKAKNQIVLDYGCGAGNVTEKIAKLNPKRLVGIDISEVSIEQAIENAKNQNFQIEYSVDNCEHTKFKEKTFDLVFGSGILHHLNLKKAINEIDRVLKNTGEMVFYEPLGTNPIINFYRKLTPKSRSTDEHPFLEKDFNLIKSLFKNVEIKYYGFFTLVFFLFYRKPENSIFFKMFCKIDRYFFKIKYFKNFAWSIMIIAKKN
jgi:ubiquinone/menaquinone biosynthesis C-methylase UbiE|tara:strand:+ start:233 stop:976 length:744 start_codon:yes stop_codon:yes gene_type:complete